MTSPPRLQWLFGLLRKGGLETTDLSIGQQEVTNRLVTSEAILDAAATLCHVGAWQITVPEGKIT